VRSGVPQGSVLGLVLFNVFGGNMDSGIECTLSKFANNTKLCGAVDTLRKGMPSRRTFRQACVNLMKFNKDKYKDLHMGCDNPKHKYRLGRD